MAGKKALAAIVVVIVLILVAWYAMYRWRARNSIFVPNTADGGTISLACQTGQSIRVTSASYTPPGAPPRDVTAALQGALDALGAASYTVNGAALGQTAGGSLSFRYRCGGAASKAGFRPVPISTCGSVYDDHYAVDLTGRNAAGTVVWDPYSTLSRVSLERYAETPEVAEEPNPFTGLGKTSRVRAWGDRYRRGETLNRLSLYEHQPGEPGFMEEVGDGAMSLMAQVARRSPAVAGGAPSCLLAGADIDSDYFSDGYYDDAVLKESLTSQRHALPNTLIASKTGLGSIRQDPRFEPGPQRRVPGGDASWSHGGHAGGPTSGGFASTRFMPGDVWDAKYIHAFGDRNILGREYPVEAVVTERSTW